MLYSLTRTCVQHHVPPLPYLSDVLRQLHHNVPAADLPDRSHARDTAARAQ